MSRAMHPSETFRARALRDVLLLCVVAGASGDPGGGVGWGKGEEKAGGWETGGGLSEGLGSDRPNLVDPRKSVIYERDGRPRKIFD